MPEITKEFLEEAGYEDFDPEVESFITIEDLVELGLPTSIEIVEKKQK